MNRKKILIFIIIVTVIIVSLVIILNSSKRYQTYFVSEEKWDSIISNREESSDLVLKKIQFNDYSLIIDESTDTIYYSLVNDSKLKYNPNVNFKTEENNVKLAILSDEITDKKVHSNYEFEMMIYNHKEYHIYHLICTDFPILNITYENELGKSKEKNISMNLYLFNNLENVAKRVTKSNGKLDIVGNEYRFRLFMNSPGRNRRENPISMFNMEPNDEYILSPLNMVSENNQKEKNEFPVEVFINNEYKGLYSLKHFGGNPKVGILYES